MVYGRIWPSRPPEIIEALRHASVDFILHCISSRIFIDPIYIERKTTTENLVRYSKRLTEILYQCNVLVYDGI